MTTITSLGTGSGLDLEGLVTKLMAAESAPLTQLQNKEKSVNSKISALGSLKSKLSDLQTAVSALIPSVSQTALNKFASFSATVSDTTIASASASTGAVAGTYSLVVDNLAVAQRQVSSSTTVLSPASGDTLSFEFATNGTTRNKTITLDSTNGSLTGLRNAINDAKMGVTATIINGTVPQLIITSEEGTANAVTLTGTHNLASAFSQTVPAEDASFSINGTQATSSTNKVTAALDGVTLNLTKKGSTSFTITQDNTTNLTSALNSFITAYNSANSLMKTQGAYDQTTKTAGVLQGNSTLRDAQSSLRGVIFGTTAGGSSAYQRLSDIGVSVAADGTLKLDSTKLSNALAKDASGVASVVSAAGTAYNIKLERIVGTTGSIQNATDGANKILKAYTDREEVLQRRLTTIEAQYRARFTALDTLIAGMKTTSTYLTQQLAALTTNSSSK